ncbi:hypothetical protein [Chryseobacterium sp.]|uniref:hypothetical protein n=1 Tax=Chryseobacterium sp. TaxID=1871047 RepID=UPI00289A3144|nr:hypothetical protein [Chryseobacterium sp.]
MKIKLLIFNLLPLVFYAQVGINTTNPTQTLDVNGSLRVRGITQVGSAAAAKDSIMAFDSDGVVKYISANSIASSADPGSVKVATNSTLSGDGSTSNPLGIAQQGAIANQVLTWNGTSWIPANQAGASNWLLTGNSNATSSNFLGTINDVPMSIKSNNTTMLEFGRRETLGLYESTSTLAPYNQKDASVSYVRGSNGISALQFEASGASFYKPIVFTDTSGNFLMRGSSAGTDFFELGSTGTNDNGQLLFTIGDDGNEPMIFRKYNYSPVAYVEMMRLQGTGLNSNVRAGINMNGTTANSTLQVNGSVSQSIATISASTTLDETQFTVICNNSSNITVSLPNASDCPGRMYILKKNTSSGTVSVSSFINSLGTSVTSITTGVYQLQSDGTNWQQIN